MKVKRTNNKNRKQKRLKIKELGKKVAPSGGKKPIPVPYTPGTLYGLAKRGNISISK